MRVNSTQSPILLLQRLIFIHKICDAVKFVPNRPSEILSAGYDSALLHFDIAQGSILSRFDIGKEQVN